jgi:hypothetical protein
MNETTHDIIENIAFVLVGKGYAFLSVDFP